MENGLIGQTPTFKTKRGAKPKVTKEYERGLEKVKKELENK